MPSKLYIIEHPPDQAFEDIANRFNAQPGDWILDWGAFPFIVWQIRPDRTYHDITATLIEPVDYFQVADQWLRQFTAQTGLHEMLAVHGYGFWWTLGSPHFEPTRSALGHNFAKIDILEAIRRQCTPEAIIVYGDKTPLENIVRRAFPASTFVNESADSLPNPDDIRGPVGMRIVRSLLSAAYFVYALFRRPDICFFAPANSLQTTVVDGKNVLQDVYFGPLSKAMRARGWRMACLETLVPVTWRHLWARGWFFPSDLIEIAGHQRLLQRGFYPRLRQRWQNKWEQTKDKIAPHITYQGYDMSALFLPLLYNHFTLIAPSLEIMVSLWQFVFKRWRPKLVYFNHCYGFIAVSVIIAAKSLGIATAELQHGVIGRHHRPYLPPTELGNSIQFPLCDHLVAWGQQTKRLLVERHVYSPDKVHVCGFPRLDRLAQDQPDRSLTLQALNIPPNAKLILYSASALIDGYIHPILKGIKSGHDDPGVYWVIKMHPGQQTRQLWEKAISDLRLERIQVVKGEFDFYALLSACDLHISYASTTFVEAALWCKPNLGLDLPYGPDFIGLLEAGLYQPVSLEALGSTTQAILYDKAARDTLVHKQQAAAQDWCLYDGRSIEHVVDAIESIVQE